MPNPGEPPAQNGSPYSPLQRRELARMVVNKLLERPCVPLAELERFRGAGVYAIYYTGDFPEYKPLVSVGECKIPIYVGKAEVEGRRRGAIDLGDASYSGVSLYNRLREHARSIEQANNLCVEDFRCRYLVVEDIWIPLAEALLIQTFRPLWNVVVDGFGIHDPGSGRSRQRRSDWDMLHPGRPWAARLPPGNSPKEIKKRIRRHLGNLASSH